jgi:hypothetical protein
MEIKIIFIAADLLFCGIFIMENVTTNGMWMYLNRASVNP